MKNWLTIKRINYPITGYIFNEKEIKNEKKMSTNIIECWDCGEEYDLNEYNYCPNCDAFPDEDEGHYDNDWEECEEDELNNEQLNTNTMTLAKLKETPREYKGIKSIVEYIDENYKGLKEQFTPVLVKELLNEKEVRGEKNEFAVKYENRLYKVSSYDISTPRYPATTSTTFASTLTFDNLKVNTILRESLDSNDGWYISLDIPLKDIYIITDYVEIETLIIKKLEEEKARFLEDVVNTTKNYDCNITEQKQYVEDVKTYGTTDRNKIKKLKAVKTLRNTKATDEELIEAFRSI